MRTDVKIGVAVAFVLVVIGVWFVIFRYSPPKPQPGANRTAEPTKNVVVAARDDRPVSTRPRAVETPASRPRSPASMPTVAIAAPATPAVPSVVRTEPASRPAEVARRTDSSERPWFDAEPARTATAPATPSAIRPGTTGTPATGRPAAAATSLPSGESRSYKVKQNDTYWSIAKAEYGDGSLYGVIQSANKNVKLVPNANIVIPPKPSATINTGTGSAAVATDTTGVTPGSIAVDQASGKRFYVVKSGDRGFHGIAREALGDARLAQQLIDANPGVNSSALKVGQKIWIPREASSRPAAAVTSTAHVTPAREVVPTPAPAPRPATPVPAIPRPIPPTPPSGPAFD